MPIQKITSGIIQDGAVVAADIADGTLSAAKIISIANTQITGNIISSQIAPNQTLNGNVTIGGTGFTKIATGTSAERPTSNVSGYVRFNSSLGYPEWYDTVTSQWYPFSNAGSYTVDFLVIAGGGAGGYRYGGGGGGGYRTSAGTSGGGAAAEATLTVASGSQYTITVGAGGAGTTIGTTNASPGFASSIVRTIDSTTLISCVGGGAAGGPISASPRPSPNAPGQPGGSGGGGGADGDTGGSSIPGGSGTAGQGYAGGSGWDASGNNNGSGGGGAGGVGGSSPNSSATTATGALVAVV
jgi:hypothetical protein